MIAAPRTGTVPGSREPSCMLLPFYARCAMRRALMEHLSAVFRGPSRYGVVQEPEAVDEERNRSGDARFRGQLRLN